MKILTIPALPPISSGKFVIGGQVQFAFLGDQFQVWMKLYNELGNKKPTVKTVIRAEVLNQPMSIAQMDQVGVITPEQMYWLLEQQPEGGPTEEDQILLVNEEANLFRVSEGLIVCVRWDKGMGWDIGLYPSQKHESMVFEIGSKIIGSV